jgi:hypothetical protein
MTIGRNDENGQKGYQISVTLDDWLIPGSQVNTNDVNDQLCYLPIFIQDPGSS